MLKAKRLLLAFGALFLLCLLDISPVLAQTGGGSVAGAVTDSTGAVLRGAKVKVHPGGATVTTNEHGEFLVASLAPGDYTVTISYPGFKDFTESISVTEGQTARLNASMVVASASQQVVVHGALEGQAEAVQDQQTSPNIVNVITAQQIASLPNASLPDAVGRLPGVTLERDEGEGKYIQIRGTQPRMNQTTVDGIVLPAEEEDATEVKLDAVPADLVDSVTVNKTLSADQPGNAIGGSADLRVRQANDMPTISLNAMGGYDQIDNGRYLDQFNGTFGYRFGHDKRLGVIFTGSDDVNHRGIDDVEPSPDPNEVTPFYDSMDIREYLYYRNRYGYSGSLDYRLGNGQASSMPSDIYLHYFDSSFFDDADKYAYTVSDPGGETGFNIPPQGSNGGLPAFAEDDRREDFFLGMLDLGGSHDLGKSFLDWSLSAANGRELNAAGDPGVSFNWTGNPNDTCAFDQAATKDPNLPQWDCPAGTLLSAGSFFYNPTNYSIGQLTTANGPTDQVNLQASVDYGRNYSFGSHSGTFQIGFRFLNEHKYQNTIQDIFDANPNADPSLFTMSNFLSNFRNDHYYFGAYPAYGPVSEWGKIIGFFNQNPGDFVLDSSDTNLEGTNNFNLFQRISSGYVMNTLQFGRFRLQTGLRFEGTQLDVHGFEVQQDANGNYLSSTPTESIESYVTPLPSAQLRYSITNDSDIRAVYGRGLSRPEPFDLAPSIAICNSCSPHPTVSLGNPALLPEHANDYDVLYEHFNHSNTGVVQGGYFYKELSDPIYYTSSLPVTSGQYAGYSVQQIINGTNAHVQGIELAYIQRFSTLPGWFSGLNLNTNLTYTESQAYGLPGRTDSPALQRQTPLSFNVMPSWTHGRFYTGLGLTYQGAFIDGYVYTTAADTAGLGPKGPGGDDYFTPHFQVDLQASVDMGHGFSTYFWGENLTDEVFGFYNGSPQYVLQREYYRPEYAVGIRWNLPQER